MKRGGAPVGDDTEAYRDFPREEYEERYRRTRALMRASGLDALLITEERNYIYFTGHRSQQNPIDKIRPYIFLLPLEEQPLVLVMPFEAGHVRDGTWVEEIRTYDLLQHTAGLESILRELGLERGRIGAELGREQYLELNLQDFEDLRRRLPQARFEDAAEVLLQVRAVKSPAEIAKCEQASALTARALHRTLSEAREGMAGLEIARRLRVALMEEGADNVTFLALGSGVDFSRGRITCATPRQIRRGETLTLDTGVEVAGYCSDVTRMAVVGPPSLAQRDLYRFMLEVQQACIDAFKPGVSCHDIMTVCQQALQRAGRTTQKVGRIGHGVGLESTEYPSLAWGEMVPLEPGMVFACNPNYVTSIGYFNSEENLVVTETGSRILSQPAAPAELPVI